MATKILLKKSLTGGSVPLIADLDAGELAVNLVDRKIYSKDGSGAIQRLDGAYVSGTAPTNPTEGDIWYDSANDQLKVHNGTTWDEAGYQTLAELEDVSFTSLTSGDHMTYNGASWVNSNFETDVEALLSAANTGTGHGDLSYANGVFTFDRVTAGEIRGEISITDNGGDGSLTYNSTSGVITYTGPSSTEVQAHFVGGTGITHSAGDISIDFSEFDTDSLVEGVSNLFFTNARARAAVSGGTGVTYSSTTGVIAIGQAVETTSNVQFNNVTVDGSLDVADNIITIAKDAPDAPTANAGLEVERGLETNKTLLWDETADKWTIGTDTFVAGTVEAALTGNVTGQVSDISNHSTTDLSEGTNLYYTDARARSALSVTDSGGDGALAYNSTTGVITYTGPSATEVRAHFTGGTGVGITDGSISIGQAVATTDTVQFAEVQSSALTHTGGTITIDPTDDGANTGEVVIAGNLTVNGTTTSVNSNEVNIGDAIIVLNADETGVASQNAGIEIERGTDANKSFIWDETNDAWTLNDEALIGVVLDGGSY